MATTTQSLTVPAKEKAERDCQCGCAPCDGSCCRLDCIVKPRFFCGQLLTDADLSALLKWARDRFGLSRYRHGWGVVCGLDVRCDPHVPTGVIVTPGYAVDCCGDDIIVCEEAPLDLKAACREEADPCADLRRRYEGTRDTETVDRRRVVDIYLRYDEKPSDPATALGRGSCKQVLECEYSRTRESYKLSWELGVMGSDPVRARATDWHDGYEKCLDVLKKFRAQFSSSFPAADVRRWLLRWIDDHPQYRLCYLRERLCRENDDFFTIQRNLVQVLFDLVQNCRNAYLNCDCFDCDAGARVPLARVWLLADDRAGGESCSIVAIDPYPPYRRPIQPDCWPAPLGSVNVGRFIWHRWDEVCPAVDDLGLHVDHREFQLPATLALLGNALQCDLFVKCDERRDALVYRTEFLGERVVGFCTSTVKPPMTTPGLTVEKTSDKTGASPGDVVIYTFTVRNTGDVELVEVDVVDKLLSFDQTIGPLPRGESRTLDTKFVVPSGAVGVLRNEVIATGTTADGKTATDSDAHALTINPTAPPVKPDLTVRKTSTTKEARPGDSVSYHFVVSNTGDVPLEVRLDDAALNLSRNFGTIQPNQSASFETSTTIPKGAKGIFENEVIATAGLPDGQKFTRSDKHAITLISVPVCPAISVSCPSSVEAGTKITFRADIQGGDTSVTPRFNWTVSAGTITSGHATSEITVDTTDLKNIQSVTANVQVGGYDPACPTSASCTTTFIPLKPGATLFDQYGDIKTEDENSRLDNFAIQLLQESSAQGFIIAHAKTREEAQPRADRARDYLVKTRAIEETRVVAQVGSEGEVLTIELWTVPNGAQPPRAGQNSSSIPNDNLTEIDQIGAARSAILNKAGITTFTDLAATPTERLKELFPGVNEDILNGWIQEAKKRSG